MFEFCKKFIKSKGKPIKYKGKTLYMSDHFPLPKTPLKLKYKILSTNSEWRQGLALNTDKMIRFDITKQSNPKSWIAVLEDEATWEDTFICEGKNGSLNVKNIWDEGRGCIESWNNGAAMWFEEIPNGRRYHCNDGHFDDDFDDIIFEIIILD